MTNDACGFVQKTNAKVDSKSCCSHICVPCDVAVYLVDGKLRSESINEICNEVEQPNNADGQP